MMRNFCVTKMSASALLIFTGLGWASGYPSGRHFPSSVSSDATAFLSLPSRYKSSSRSFPQNCKLAARNRQARVIGRREARSRELAVPSSLARKRMTMFMSTFSCGNMGLPHHSFSPFSHSYYADGVQEQQQHRQQRQRQRRSPSARLMVDRRYGGESSREDYDDNDEEDDSVDRTRDHTDDAQSATRRSGATAREDLFYGKSIPASKRRPPEDEDIWSKSSVFEFKSLNDPDTNASLYQGFTGVPGSDYPGQEQHDQQSPNGSRATDSRTVSPDLRLTTKTQEVLPWGSEEVQRLGNDNRDKDDNLFQFREKETLTRTVEASPTTTRERGAGDKSGGGGTGGRVIRDGTRSAVTVELATQLGLPATATYEELRAAYRVEVKRCHPDVAGDNEFRVKLLERRFQRLTSTWEKFVEEQTVPSQGSSSSRQAATATGRSARRSSERSSSSSATSEPGARRQSVQAQVARARNREQARAKAEQEAHAAAAAAVAARQKSRRVMDPGREILDAGGPSC